MKLNTERFGIVEVIERTDNSLIVRTSTGDVKTLMTAFIKFYDMDGCQVTDFSNIKMRINFTTTRGASAVEKKDSYIRRMVSENSNRNEVLNYMID